MALMDPMPPCFIPPYPGLTATLTAKYTHLPQANDSVAYQRPSLPIGSAAFRTKRLISHCTTRTLCTTVHHFSLSCLGQFLVDHTTTTALFFPLRQRPNKLSHEHSCRLLGRKCRITRKNLARYPSHCFWQRVTVMELSYPPTNPLINSTRDCTIHYARSRRS